MSFFFLLWCAVFFIPSIHATILVISTNDTYMDRAALFGPTIAHDAPLAGRVKNIAMMTTADRYGCTPIPDAPTTEWIALVERGHCSFVAKVRAMQQSNAKAVIVGDPYLNHWLTMYALEDTSDIKIPSVYVAQYQFRALQIHALETRLIELINDSNPVWSWADMLMVMVLSPCMMLLMIYFACKCLTYRRHLNNVASCYVVSRLPTRHYHQTKELEDDQDTCAICLESYLENEHLRILPCRHEFHDHCIDPWLTTCKKVCPICKFDVCQDTPSPPKQHHRFTEHTPLLPI